jgi:hypothetical protein
MSQGGEKEMPDNLIGEVRRSAVVMTYAPGSIMDMRADGGPVSVVCAGLEEWDSSAPLIGNLKYQKIIERRLCKKLDKKYFRLPPVLEDGAKYPHSDKLDNSALVGRRFPEWLQCPVCEVMKPASKWQADPGRAYRYCPQCTTKEPGRKKIFVVPVRFASACNMGHLDEFPWYFWVNHKVDCKNSQEYKLTSTGPGLAGLLARCLKCGASRSLDGAFSKTALNGLSCQGKRPWLRKDDVQCSCTGKDGNYRVVQRGASNLYYPVLESALDIPPWTRNLERILGDYWDVLSDIPDPDDRLKYIQISDTLKAVLKRENISAEKLANTFSEMVAKLDQADLSEIRLDEYRVFASGMAERDPEFEIYPEKIPNDLSPFISSVVRVSRLREVRVIRGFTRIIPPYDSEESNIAPISVDSLDWLPAVEVRGEGIFIQLNIKNLISWEKSESVNARSKVAEESWGKEWASRNEGKEKPFEASPRLLLLHSFAHALIRQLTLECGYSSASLRERMYVSEGADGMAGVLIYTSTPDSDGTLGGLQRRAMPDLLDSTIKSAIKSLQWCSSDPLCINGEMALLESHSVASCHSCVMVPETSCEFHNRFLDRGLLVGSDQEPDLGFFRALI